MSERTKEIARELQENGPGWESAVLTVRPDMHNALRQECGMDSVNHCANCWGVMKDGKCRECGGNTIYGETDNGEGDE